MSVIAGKSTVGSVNIVKSRALLSCSPVVKSSSSSKISIKQAVKPKTACKAASDYKSDINDIKQAIDALTSKLEGALEQPVQEEISDDAENSSSKSGDLASAGFSCDDSGCVLLGPGDEEVVHEPTDNGRVLDLDDALVGEEFVLGMMGDTAEGGNFCAVVGGRDWNVSLTHSELRDFIQAMRSVRSTILRIVAVEGCAAPTAEAAEHLPPIRIKYNTKSVKMEAVCNRNEGCQNMFALSFSIGVGGLRLVRGTWSANVVQEVLTALDANVEGFAEDPLLATGGGQVESEAEAAAVMAAEAQIAAMKSAAH
uniref:Uncharacterized protein n=1 Tax=Polytomella parva TaxID=51329 RepID=A0A7S0YQU5_9CHLO|mmetsp:Transcript_32814/g.59467  ORF Transcript_32814/g.59467 Transcript_32814/m.59467 type:complete len:311 (+) Transcript_32814:134-1066(+)|eukprot:CAMPEP_0175058448 /NCGR_PEP_ID=MMETSP0052_2-20121109/11854_1 /TAXON_ID=51329 ORGANISM="Polytomella parva, Strain SAG 63-3" /NCGR_SAMPLE_ID=MMETSP0052_2 /ASSEMBLY_ACC=CAM_ASM_000194 /LENGTH=310 /DNA_ID=CAMNT_0016323831 /DNA_START=74 /DNA_END=1006 /DNA_ORIENTATION=+